ncbi:MAG: hypothetical protein QXS45_00570 [Sulfolobales archaeon]
MKSFIRYKLLQVLRDPLSIVLLIVFLYMLIFLYIPLAVSVGEILLGGGVNTGIIANSLPILVRSVLIALISSALYNSLSYFYLYSDTSEHTRIFLFQEIFYRSK